MKIQKTKEFSKNKTTNQIILTFVNDHKYKCIIQSFTANWISLKLYPKFWLNKSITTPNFNHWSFTIRFLWWYFGIQKKFTESIKEEED